MLAVSGSATRSRTGARTTSTSLPLKGDEMLASMAGAQVFVPVAWKPVTGPARKFHCSSVSLFSEVLRYVGCRAQPTNPEARRSVMIASSAKRPFS